MKIVYFYQYFTTPKGSYGTRVYEFTKEWVKAGHDVTVVTSVYSKSDIKAKGLINNQEIEGIKLKIINVLIDNKQPTLKRIYTFLLYSILSLYYALTLKADVVIASSGPITVGLPGLFAKWFRRKKFVFEVRDLWPEAPIELGIINNKLIKLMSYKFEKTCYNNADLIVALSPGMKDNIKQRFPYTNTISVTNSANFQLFSTKNNFFPLKEIIGKKYAIYTGNIGMVNNSLLLYKTSLLLKQMGRNDIHIVLIGDGQQKKDLLEKSKNLVNFHVFDLMPKNQLIYVIKNAIASVIPLKDTPVLNTSSPNKLFESMAASVPIIQTTTGWIKEMIEKSKSGYTVSPNDEKELANKLILLADDPDLQKKLGHNAYEYAEKNFNKEYLSKKMLENILAITK